MNQLSCNRWSNQASIK